MDDHPLGRVAFGTPLRRFAVLLACLVVIASAAAGCRPSPQQTGPPEKITIAFPTLPNSTLVHIALAKGYFTQEGLDVTPQPYAFGKAALDALIEGKADLAAAADTPIMYAVMDGVKIMVLTAIYASDRSTGILARRDRGISEPSDFKGKKIGVTRGTSGDFIADIFLLVHGIDRKQAAIIDLHPDEMTAALRAGRVDAVSIWIPILTQLQKEWGKTGTTFYSDALYTATVCLVGNRDYVEKHPGAVKKVLRALDRAETFTRENPGEARRLAADFIKTDRSVLDEIWGILDLRLSLNQSLIVSLENQTRWAMKHRLTKHRDMPNYLDFIYIEGLHAVRPESVRIIR
jgi:NitT/TauT family transport system substrate-binding protein